MSLEIEIRNFFPQELEPELKGNLHVAVRIGDIAELHIRAVLVSKKKDRWFFKMPFKSGFDYKTGMSVVFPVLTFSPKGLNKIVLDAVYQKGPVFIADFMKAHPQVYTLPANKVREESKQAPASEPQAAAPVVKISKGNVSVAPSLQSACVEPKTQEFANKPKSVKTTKVFYDLPPRKKEPEKKNTTAKAKKKYG